MEDIKSSTLIPDHMLLGYFIISIAQTTSAWISQDSELKVSCSDIIKDFSSPTFSNKYFYRSGNWVHQPQLQPGHHCLKQCGIIFLTKRQRTAIRQKKLIHFAQLLNQKSVK